MTISIIDLIAVCLAAVAGGFVNAIAGGGTLITFHADRGRVPPVIANVTNTVALCPGYVAARTHSATICRGRRNACGCSCPRASSAASPEGPAPSTSDATFRKLIPYLIPDRGHPAGVPGPAAKRGHGAYERSDSTHPHEAWAIR